MRRPLAELLEFLRPEKIEDVRIARPTYPPTPPFVLVARVGADHATARELAVTEEEASDYFRLRGLDD